MRTITNRWFIIIAAKNVIYFLPKYMCNVKYSVILFINKIEL